jgi:hypothetical protein
VHPFNRIHIENIVAKDAVVLVRSPFLFQLILAFLFPQIIHRSHRLNI